MTDDIGAGHPGMVVSGVERATSGDTVLFLDMMLGKLAMYLWVCGHDAECALDGEDEIEGGADGACDPRADPGDDNLFTRADVEGRILLTRDVQPAKRAPRNIPLAKREPLTQLRELGSVGFAVSPDEEPPRYGVHNGRVEVVGRDGPVPDYASDLGGTALQRCRNCGRAF